MGSFLSTQLHFLFAKSKAILTKQVHSQVPWRNGLKSERFDIFSFGNTFRGIKFYTKTVNILSLLMNNRRNFLKNSWRYIGATTFASALAFLKFRSSDKSPHQCLNNICRNCQRQSNCILPRAKSFRKATKGQS